MTQSQPPYMQQGSMEAPGATAGMVLGILSIILAFSCSLAGLVVGIIGMQKSRQAKMYIERNPGQYVNASNANVGHICSLIGLILSIVFTLLSLVWVLLFVVLAAASASA